MEFHKFSQGDYACVSGQAGEQITIYKIEGHYSISVDHQWFPGLYDSPESAIAALAFSDEDISGLWDSLNPIPLQESHYISIDDILNLNI